jgi:hypothetical protein
MKNGNMTLQEVFNLLNERHAVPHFRKQIEIE